MSPSPRRCAEQQLATRACNNRIPGGVNGPLVSQEEGGARLESRGLLKDRSYAVLLVGLHEAICIGPLTDHMASLPSGERDSDSMAAS